MLTTSRKTQQGLNLVELMIGLVVGMIVLAAMTVVYLNTTRGSKTTLNANRLNQDLRAVMDVMVSDIRRAGYWGTAAAGSANPFTNRTIQAAPLDKITDIYVSSGCILYSYDATFNGGTSGTADTGVDFFGFRLNGGAVQTVTTASNLGNTSTACSNVNNWQALTDSSVINVSTLTFSTASPGGGEPGSQCINTDTSASWTAAVSTSPACNDTTASGYAAPASGNHLAETRQITISITANYINPADPNDLTLQRTLSETVLVRNNRLITVP